MQQQLQSALQENPEAALPGSTLGAVPQVQSLPIGALELDSRGRILDRMPKAGQSRQTDSLQLAGKNFFEEYCRVPALEALGEIYLRGVLRGELYHFVDLRVTTGHDSREVTLFLYYHLSTGQGWAFVEPHSPMLPSGRAPRSLA